MNDKINKISYKEFVSKYKAGKLNIYVYRSNALKTINMGYLPKRYYWAHTFWSWVWFLSIPLGIIMLFINTTIGVAILFFLSFLGGKAVKQSASNFIIQHALDNKEFYKFVTEGEVLVIRKK